MTDDTQTDLTPKEQLTAAIDRFAAVNRTLPPGIQGFELPPFLEPSCGLDALVNLLIEKGVIGEHEFIDRKSVRMAEVVDQLVEAAQEAKRSALGIILAGADAIPGQPGARTAG